MTEEKKQSYRVIEAGTTKTSGLSVGKHTQIKIKRPRGLKGRVRFILNGQPVKVPARVLLRLADQRLPQLETDQ